MPPKEKTEFKAKTNSKSVMNKPKGGAAKDAERAKKKEKDAAKAGVRFVLSFLNSCASIRDSVRLTCGGVQGGGMYGIK